MNKTKKIIKKIIITFFIFILNSLSFFNCVQAVENFNINIYSAGDCGDLLIYKGVVVKAYYAEYTKDGVSYPAYCMDKTKKGIENGLSYNVSVSETIKDVGLWKIIINGYPYKTIQELGVANKQEAFTATKQAIYCYIHGNKLSDYSGIGEAGKRTLNAMSKIISDAQNSKETKISNTVTINKLSKEWKQDNIDKNYVSKTYNISAPAPIQNYKVKVSKEGSDNIGGIKITDEKNNEKQEFNSSEKFKILIPIKNMTEKGKIKLEVQTKINTKPIFYGKAPDSTKQDYALTTATYEDGIGESKEEYFKNETKLIIIKKDEETNETLQGVEFELLDENKNVVYADLKTDEEGKITVENLVPAIYYLKETKSIDNYEPYDELIKLELNLNETITVTVNNKKEKEPTIEITQKQMEVKKLPKTGF